MTYYIADTTIKPQRVMKFETYPELVGYLDGVSQRAFGQTRKQRMILLEEVGHGNDDSQSINFVRTMSESFNIGIIREGQLMRCDITSIALYQKEEYGN